MSESEKTRKRSRKQQTYKHKTNAVNITLFDPHGETIPASVRHEAEQAILDLAMKHQLLISIALT